MHLTNYAINKLSTKFLFNEGTSNDFQGHKRSLSSTLEYLETNYNLKVQNFWEKIYDIAKKTIIIAQPHLAHAYHNLQPEDYTNQICFQILGLDIPLDQNLKPWLLEVNHSPSFNTDTPLDKQIKIKVVIDALSLLNLSLKNKIKIINQQ